MEMVQNGHAFTLSKVKAGSILVPPEYIVSNHVKHVYATITIPYLRLSMDILAGETDRLLENSKKYDFMASSTCPLYPEC